MIKKTISKQYVVWFLFCCFTVFCGGVAIAQNGVIITQKAGEHLPFEIPYNAEYFEIEARIMQIDLDNNFMIIAEKTIKLPTTITRKGDQKFAVIFKDSKGKNINAKSLKQRDNVVVYGYKTKAGEIFAKEIILGEREAL